MIKIGSTALFCKAVKQFDALVTGGSTMKYNYEEIMHEIYVF